MQSEIKQVEDQFEAFTQKVGSLQGEYKTLLSQQNNSNLLINKLKEDEETYIKAVELLSLVQKIAQHRIKDSFENIVSWALSYIFKDDYRFCFEFGRRGNLSELDFAVKTPDLNEAFDPMDTRGGGILNVISLILRIVLMEVINPKTNGYIIFDESFKNVNGQEFIDTLNSFLLDIHKKFKRQIIHITDMENFKSDDRYNLIEVK